jgi:EamA-like transporter family
MLGAVTLAADCAGPAAVTSRGCPRWAWGLPSATPLFLALAVQKVPASHAAVVIALVPAATAVLSAAWNSERLPRPFWLACLTGLAAVTGYAATSGGASAPCESPHCAELPVNDPARLRL